MVRLLAGNSSIDCNLIVFDKDGTLVDLTQVLFGLAIARRLMVKEHGGKEVADVWQKMMGVDIDLGKIDHAGPLATVPRQQEILIAAACFYLRGYSWEEAQTEARQAYDDADKSMKPPFSTVLLDGVEAKLKQLKAHGCKLAIASTDTHRRITGSFEALGIATLFDAFVGDDDVVSGKPAPDMIFEAMNHVGGTPEQTVMVGDSVSDMRMGRNAKVRTCIGVLTGFAKKEQLEQFADAIVPSVADLQVL